MHKIFIFHSWYHPGRFQNHLRFGAILLFGILPLNLFALNAADEYYSTENSILKVEALRKIDLSNRSNNNAQVIELLKDAMNHKSFKVVEQALLQSGKIRGEEIGLEEAVVSVMNSAQERFNGNSERVIIAAYNALSKIGSEKTVSLLNEDLLDLKKLIYASAILDAMKNNNSGDHIDVIKSFIIMMDSKINSAKSAGADPILYSKYMSLKDQAEIVSATIIEKGDN